MTSSTSNNRCKLLVLDLDTNRITIHDLRIFFTSYGPVEWIEIFPETTSAMIYFVSYLIVDRLVTYGTCFIDGNNVRLRRFRLDQTNWHIDSHTLYMKLSNYLLTEISVRFCFRDYQSSIKELNIIDDNQALISFSNYDHVDRILLMPGNMFMIDGVPLIFERMMQKIPKKTRWDEKPFANIPVLSVRDPVVYKLISHIEYLTRQLRDRPNQSRNDLDRLEAEVFVLKNENAKLKRKQQSSSNQNIEQRLMALEDISNRLVNKPYQYNRQERSNSNEKRFKRRREYENDNDYSNLS